MRMWYLCVDRNIKIVAHEITMFYIYDVKVCIVISSCTLNFFPGCCCISFVICVQRSIYQFIYFTI